MSDGIQYAGEYTNAEFTLFSSSGSVIGIERQGLVIYIYENIYSPSMSGEILFLDTNSFVKNLPIIGQEFVEMKLSTPQLNETADSVIEKKFVINTIASRESISVGAQAYSFELSTQDSIVNRKTRVSKSYTGSISNTVFDILSYL